MSSNDGLCLRVGAIHSFRNRNSFSQADLEFHYFFYLGPNPIPCIGLVLQFRELAGASSSLTKSKDLLVGLESMLLNQDGDSLNGPEPRTP